MLDLTQSGDQRYKGKKASRKSLRSEEVAFDSDEADAVDKREHAQAELGHLLEGSDDDDDDEEYQDEDDQDQNVEKEEDMDPGVDFGAFGGASDDNGTDTDQSEDGDGDVT